MSKKKRNKKYNPKAGQKTLARRMLRNTVVGFVTGQDDLCHFFDLKTNQKIVASESMVNLTGNYPYFWTLHLAGFGIKTLADGSQKDYMETEVIRTTSEYYQRDLVNFFNDRHQALLKSMNQNRLCGAGWIASMNDIELSDADQIKIYSKLGAWQ